MAKRDAMPLGFGLNEANTGDFSGNREFFGRSGVKLLFGEYKGD